MMEAILLCYHLAIVCAVLASRAFDIFCAGLKTRQCFFFSKTKKKPGLMKRARSVHSSSVQQNQI
jgi:hypothetical protein